MTQKKVDTMEVWSKVDTTDPKYTKKVNQRGGFTAIGAQYQLKKATELFGPFGKGWGVVDEQFHHYERDGLFVYSATLWYKLDGEPYEFPINSSIAYSKNGRIDDDFAKKVTTDALTKGLSKLGFNADVFMGKFDDNKYVSSLSSSISKKVGDLTNPNGILSDAQKKEIQDQIKCLPEDDAKKVVASLESGKITKSNFSRTLTKLELMVIESTPLSELEQKNA
jgi:hypothetical protein